MILFIPLSYSCYREATRAAWGTGKGGHQKPPEAEYASDFSIPTTVIPFGRIIGVI
jgi:hypothetical protein